ncbi:MAG: MBL fold metallo-hydrolase [Sediminibacterium magnilacihabitans]|jgi:glyoxylase-like metal-dependent hydrolase (beta-lactamase superfamily II)/rhodanese-related sulfurtransferase|nr:MBL fold metallo-hydrolase [Sediminibacterium magnilacihabitans]PQV62052.1 glyoxylase-like metal-dependent hydrolase (beta-lactamase superfamily II) [Sediminibacterium magnilacihabitans]
MEGVKEISSNTLRNWLETGKEVSILDIRPIQERAEWFIPGSIYYNAYDKLKANNPNALQGLHLDRTLPVVTICAGGKTSMIAASLLQKQGFEAYSLQGGMKGWSLSWNTAMLSFPDFEVIQIRRTGKGCLSYLIASNNEAIIVDASLPVEAYQEALQKNRLTLKHVIETHIHADHLSRAKQLAEINKVTLHLPVPNKVNFDFIPVTGSTVFQIGNISIKAIQTPGHTLESTSYLVDDKILLTGDTLFINGVGRPDLKANNEEAMQKSKMLYQSLQKLLALDENIIALPAHTNQPVDFDSIPVQATIGSIKHNVAMLKLSEEEFVNTILQRIPPTPANYLSIVEKNINGDFSDINPVDLEAGANRCAVS